MVNSFKIGKFKMNQNFNQIWADKGSQFKNKSMKLFLRNNDTEIYSTHNEEKTLKTKLFIVCILIN